VLRFEQELNVMIAQKSGSSPSKGLKKTLAGRVLILGKHQKYQAPRSENRGAKKHATKNESV